MPETNTRMLGLKSGGHDIVNVVPLNQAKAVEEDPNLTLEVAPSFRLDYVYMNHRVKPLDDKRIRLAMEPLAKLSVDSGRRKNTEVSILGRCMRRGVISSPIVVESALSQPPIRVSL